MTAALLVVGLALAGCTAAGPGAPSEVVVGVITSRTGASALDGQDWTLGFEAGLAKATNGSETANGIRIVVDYRDDTSDPATATSLAADLTGEGATVLAGPVADATALAVADASASAGVLFVAGSATTDALTARSRTVFRSGHQIAQEVAAAAAVAGVGSGQTMAVLSSDDTAGQAFLASASTVLSARGATPQAVTPPVDSTGFVKPIRDMVFPNAPTGVVVRWPGAGAPQLWRDAAGIPDALTDTRFVTQLGAPASWGQYGPATAKTSFVSAWLPGAASGADSALVAAAGDQASSLGPAAADGYLAGLMVAKAIGDGKGQVDGMVAALEGATFDGPTGSVTVRASDHALLADEFQVTLTATGTSVTGSVTAVLKAADIAPPESSMPTDAPSPTG